MWVIFKLNFFQNKIHLTCVGCIKYLYINKRFLSVCLFCFLYTTNWCLYKLSEVGLQIWFHTDKNRSKRTWGSDFRTFIRFFIRIFSFFLHSTMIFFFTFIKGIWFHSFNLIYTIRNHLCRNQQGCKPMGGGDHQGLTSLRNFCQSDIEYAISYQPRQSRFEKQLQSRFQNQNFTSISFFFDSIIICTLKK